MRLRRPCEHDRYDEHLATLPCSDPDFLIYHDSLRGTCTALHSVWCPGGQFLPEDTLVIELGTPPLWLREIIGEWGLDFDPFMADVEDAFAESLADQVGEPG